MITRPFAHPRARLLGAFLWLAGLSGGAALHAQTTYESEAYYATRVGVTTSTVYAGYSGTGYGDYQSSTGDYIEWTLNAASAGTYPVVFRFANGSTANRPLELRVNGVVANAGLAFPPSGGWSTWTLTATSNLSLNAGANTVRLTATGSSGGNVDYLQVTAPGTSIPPPPAPGVTVDLSVTHQTIRGFGGASVWQGILTDANADKLFLNGPGQLGMTINRVRIDPAGGSSWNNEITNAQKATARGAIVMATPWSPPAALKDNNNTIGGSLLPGNYGAYAAHLQSFINTLAANGVSLHAISLQNEPEYSPTYEGCVWTPAQLLDFTKNHAGSITGARFMMAESFNFDHTMTDPTLNDPIAAANVDIIAGHIYGGGEVPYPLASDMGAEVWMTEHLEDNTTLAGAINTGLEITRCLAQCDFNAYLTWWWRRYYSVIDDGTTGGVADTVTKRGHVMGQFSKFVRPGFVRVSSTYNADTTVYTSAYKSGSTVVIVAVNTGTTAINEPFTLTGGTLASVTPYRTSATENIAALATIPVVGGSFTTSLPAQSVTTFVGTTEAPPSPPAAPTGLSATAISSGQIDLAWTSSVGATGYNVKRATTSGGPYVTIAPGVVSSNYIDPGRSASTTYHYVVSALNAVGESAASAQASATTLADTTPPAFVAAGAAASGTATITPALPSGIATGDILLLFVETANQTSAIANPNGGTWAAVTASPQGTGTAAGSTATRLTALWSRYNGTQGAPTVSDSGNHQLARMIAIRGAAPSGNPWDVAVGASESTSDISANIPGAITVVDNTLVVVAVAGSLPDANGTSNFSTWTNANLTALTERTDNAVTAGNGGSLGIATGVKTSAGAYGTTAATHAASAVKGMISIAIKK